VRLPIANDLPFIDSLSLDAGYRYSKYTLGGKTNTTSSAWNGLRSGMSVCGGYNRAVRAPNLTELFQPATVGAGGTADPCWGPEPYPVGGTVRANGCKRQPVRLPRCQPGGPDQHAGGWQPRHIKPEIADTYTAGVVLEPQMVPNLIASIDVYYIKIRDTITSLSSNTVINDCALTGDATLCGLIHRGPAGDLWFQQRKLRDGYVREYRQDLHARLDLSTHHHVDIGQWGKLSTNFSGTYVKDFSLSRYRDWAPMTARLLGSTCNAPVPHWRHV